MPPHPADAAGGRIATLDGWRGIAILLVLAEHAGHEAFPNQTWANLGSLGVGVFFVLSGYIITARLLAERQRTSTIHLKSFYIRRAFRILPLVLCYLLVLCVLSAFRTTGTEPSQIAGALFFFRNYQFAAYPVGIYTAHFWSLSIEEHFYLFWPLLLLRAGNRRALWIAVAGGYACALWRVYDRAFPNGPVTHWLPGLNEGLRSLRTDVSLDGLLLGSALAILFLSPAVKGFVLDNFPKEAPLVAATLMMIMNRPWAMGYGTLTLYSLLTVTIASTLIVHEGLAWKWLNSRLLVWLGTVSYSLYIWQQLFLQHPIGTRPLGPFSLFPWNLLCALTMAVSSYYLLERPLIRAGHRLTRTQEPAPVTEPGPQSLSQFPVL